MRGSSIRRKTAYTSKNELKEKEEKQCRQSEERKKQTQCIEEMNRQLELLKDCEVAYSQALLQMKQIEKQKNEWEEIQKQKIRSGRDDL